MPSRCRRPPAGAGNQRRRRFPDGGTLAQGAIEDLRASTGDRSCSFVAVRLPQGRAVGVLGTPDPSARDLVLGNIKARMRMMAQYAIANACDGPVIGTDHAAEAVIGFFTKFGDGACDLTPLAGLVKGQVRAIASRLGAPARLVTKVPTADLEQLEPGKPDETAYGITYDEIDDFLHPHRVSPSAESRHPEAVSTDCAQACWDCGVLAAMHDTGLECAPPVYHSAPHWQHCRLRSRRRRLVYER